MKPVLVLAAVGVVAFVGWKLTQGKPPEAALLNDAANPLAPKEASVSLGIPGARAPEKPLFTAPRAPVKVEDVEISAPCRALWSDLGALDLKEAMHYPPRKVTLPLGDKCQGLPGKLDEKHKAFLNACGAFLTEPEKISSQDWKKLAPQCQMAAFFYRAAVTDFLTKGEKLSEIKDPKVLADKLMNQFVENPKYAAEIAERLLQVEPGFYPAAKAVAMSRFMDAQERAATDPKNPVWEQVKKDLERASQMNPDDRKQQTELQLLTELRQNRDPGKLQARAEQAAREFPQDGGGPYYAAWAANMKGDRAAVVSWLEEAMRRSPSDERYKQTYEKIKKGEADAFSSDLSFSPEIR